MNDLTEKKKEYYWYIVSHQNNVKRAFIYLFNEENITRLIKESLVNRNDVEKLREKIVDHDSSKFSDEEFDAYRRKFYKTDEERNEEDNAEEILQKVEDDFAKALNHHYINNDHHPKYWKFRKIAIDDEGNKYLKRTNIESNPLPMTRVAILHMICDWEAMGIQYNSNTLQWYETATEEKNDMNPKTKELVEKILNVLYDPVYYRR